jgi:hypothetical protein
MIIKTKPPSVEADIPSMEKNLQFEIAKEFFYYDEKQGLLYWKKRRNRNRALSSTNTSGVIGICKYKNSKKWAARITVNGRFIHLVFFDTKKEAIKVSKEAERKFGFHENHDRAPNPY